MASILRGEIYWADLNPTIAHEQAGIRPILIISNNIFNKRSGTVIALALTSKSQKAGYPLTLELNNPELPRRSWVKISQIRTLSVLRMKNKICEISPEVLDQIIEGFNEIIGD